MGDPCLRGSTWGSRPRQRANNVDFGSTCSSFGSTARSTARSTGGPWVKPEAQAKPLPPIGKLKLRTPLSFEDMYSKARTRVATKSAKQRKGGLSSKGSLPSFPSSPGTVSPRSLRSPHSFTRAGSFCSFASWQPAEVQEAEAVVAGSAALVGISGRAEERIEEEAEEVRAASAGSRPTSSAALRAGLDQSRFMATG